jgi:hypothetical protein
MTQSGTDDRMLLALHIRLLGATEAIRKCISFIKLNLALQYNVSEDPSLSDPVGNTGSRFKSVL